MQGSSLILFIYVLVLLAVCLQIIFATSSSTKALAYLLFSIFVPVLGIGFYLTFGINYWRKKKYTGKLFQNDTTYRQIEKDVAHYSPAFLKKKDISLQDNAELMSMLLKDLNSPLTAGNQLKILVNGEEKFPELIQCIKAAKHHIHVHYYIYEQDKIGEELIELLIKKAAEGVEVRFIYDDFGSHIKRNMRKRMMEAGIEVYPFHKVHFYLLANRINYRNHRKIVVVDGQTGFTGGINVSDKYINNGKHKLFWRDTHLRIDGPGVYYLQYLFITDWNFCSEKKLQPSTAYFSQNLPKGNKYIQIAASGPDSVSPSIMFSILEAIYVAKEEILITTPYFIPGESIMDALRIAATSGVAVKLLVPGICDSKFVNAASKDHYGSLLRAGVEIYVYQKGFVHAKTMVTDGKLSMIGTANMDHRSFELNFEVNAIIYDSAFSKQLRDIFFTDLKEAEKIIPEEWYKRSWFARFTERSARLFSPSL